MYLRAIFLGLLLISKLEEDIYMHSGQVAYIGPNARLQGLHAESRSSRTWSCAALCDVSATDFDVEIVLYSFAYILIQRLLDVGLCCPVFCRHGGINSNPWRDSSTLHQAMCCLRRGCSRTQHVPHVDSDISMVGFCGEFGITMGTRSVYAMRVVLYLHAHVLLHILPASASLIARIESVSVYLFAGTLALLALG